MGHYGLEKERLSRYSNLEEKFLKGSLYEPLFQALE
jgi:hypothetical protein